MEASNTPILNPVRNNRLVQTVLNNKAPDRLSKELGRKWRWFKHRLEMYGFFRLKPRQVIEEDRVIA